MIKLDTTLEFMWMKSQPNLLLQKGDVYLSQPAEHRRNVVPFTIHDARYDAEGLDGALSI